MFQKGEYIVYGSIGVCRVEDVGIPEHISQTDRMYYTLRPVYQAGVIYIPVQTKMFMRPLLTREEVMKLIKRMPEIQEEMPEREGNLRMVSNRYEASFRTHDCEDLIHLIKGLYIKEQTVRQNGRQLGQMDQQYFKRAEELLYGEFAIVLGLPLDEVRTYLERVISEQKNQIEKKASDGE